MAKKPKILYDEYTELMEELYSMIEKDEPLEEKFASKAQQRYFYWKAGQKGKGSKKWKKMADEFSDTMSKKDWEKLPEKMTSESVENINPKMTKKSLMEYVKNNELPKKITKEELIKKIK
jgi:hypothetical protein